MQRKSCQKSGGLEVDRYGDHYGILTGGGESGQTGDKGQPRRTRSNTKARILEGFLRGPSCPWRLARLLTSPNSCHDLDVKILSLLAVPLALAGHETRFGEASR